MDALPSGWVKVTGASLWRLVWSTPTRPSGLTFLVDLVLLQAAIQIGLHVARDSMGVAALVIAVAAVVALIAAVLVWAASRSQTPRINFDDSLVRVGRTTYRFDQITDAAFLLIPHRSGPSGYLRFGTGALRTAALVCVRSNRDPEITDLDRELVAEVLRRSSVRVPEAKPDPYDPTGRFAWMDYPNNLSRKEAVEYVLRTPADGEPVRSAPRPRAEWVEDPE